jgi:hypothetical protein
LPPVEEPVPPAPAVIEMLSRLLPPVTALVPPPAPAVMASAPPVATGARSK